jgi:hypothetical protein
VEAIIGWVDRITGEGEAGLLEVRSREGVQSRCFAVFWKV